MNDDATATGDNGQPAADPLQAGLEQFQRAALEAIGAARSMLEVAESLVRDPAAIEAAVQTVAAFGRMAADTIGRAAAGRGEASGSDAESEAHDDDVLHRIRVD